MKIKLKSFSTLEVAIDKATNRVTKHWERKTKDSDSLAFWHTFQAIQFSFFEKELLLIQALIVSAPLIGLLGTVLGMIETFQGIAEAGMPSTMVVSKGISKALITTQYGLLVALPALIGLTALKKKNQFIQVCRKTLEVRCMTNSGEISG